MGWWYICINAQGRKVTDRSTTDLSVATIIPTFLARGTWRDDGWPSGVQLELADWRWNKRWRRFTIKDTFGGTHIIKEVP